MAGVSQSTESQSARLLAEAGAPLMRTWRRSGATAAVPVPISTGGADPRRHREAAGAAAPRHLAEARAPQTAPRRQQRYRLKHIGLPCAILAGEDHEARPRRHQKVGIGTEIGQAQPVDRHAHSLEQAPPPSQLAVIGLGDAAMKEIEPEIAAHEVDGNRLTLLADGPQRLEALIGLVDEARTSLRLLYYIWNEDESGTRLRDALVRAAERGVEVALLVDGFGASDATRRLFRAASEAGARFCRFVPRYGRRYLLRNHQKLALADGRRVIIGGFNISDDYFGTIAEGAWRDLGLSSRATASIAWSTISNPCSPGR